MASIATREERVVLKVQDRFFELLKSYNATPSIAKKDLGDVVAIDVCQPNIGGVSLAIVAKGSEETERFAGIIVGMVAQASKHSGEARIGRINSDGESVLFQSLEDLESAANALAGKKSFVDRSMGGRLTRAERRCV